MLRLPSRLTIVDSELKINRLRNLLEHQSNLLPGAFVVIDKDKIRFRPLLGGE